MLAFLKNLAGVKMDKAAQAGVEALVRWDPKSASEAELRTMEQRLDDLGREIALARQSYDKEQRESDTIQALSHQRMAAAEQLQRQVDAENDPARKAPLEKSLETLVSMLEQMTPRSSARRARLSTRRTMWRCWSRPTPRPAANSRRHAPNSRGPSAIWRARPSNASGPISRQKRRGGQRGSPARRAA
jgi:hypothetical protein